MADFAEQHEHLCPADELRKVRDEPLDERELVLNGLYVALLDLDDPEVAARYPVRLTGYEPSVAGSFMLQLAVLDHKDLVPYTDVTLCGTIRLGKISLVGPVEVPPQYQSEVAYLARYEHDEPDGAFAKGIEEIMTGQWRMVALAG